MQHGPRTFASMLARISSRAGDQVNPPVKPHTTSVSKSTSTQPIRTTPATGSSSKQPINTSAPHTSTPASSHAATTVSSPAAPVSATSVATGPVKLPSTPVAPSAHASFPGEKIAAKPSRAAVQHSMAVNASTESTPSIADAPHTSAASPSQNPTNSPATTSTSHATTHVNEIVPAVLLALALATAFTALLWYFRRRRRNRAGGVSDALFYQDTSVPGIQSTDDAAASFYSLPSAGLFAAGMITPDADGEACRESSELDNHRTGPSASALSFIPREIVPVAATACTYEPSPLPYRPATTSTAATAQYATVPSPAWAGEPSPTEWTPTPLPPPPARRAPSTRTVGSRASSERLARRNNRLLAALSDTPVGVPSRPPTPAGTEFGGISQPAGQPAELEDNPFGDEAHIFAM